MSFLQIIVLALIQGVSEYLPISSEGHNILVPVLTGWDDQGKLADAVINLGTLFATVVFFWRDVLSMLRGILDVVRGNRTSEARLLCNVIVATVPILVVGLFLEKTHLIDHMRNAELVAINAIIFGVLLYTADAFGLQSRSMADMNWKTSLVVGCAQAIALSPGTSRSGITITAGRALGFVRSEAARFAFLVGIPANAAASLFVVGGAFVQGQHISFAVVLTTVLTFFVALGTITVLMMLVRKISFLVFSVYRVVLGGALLGLIYSGVPLS